MGKFDSFFDDAVVNAKAAASAVSKKAVTFYDASKHKISAAEIRGEINKKLKELGKVTYKSEVHGTDLFAEKEQLIAEIKELIENSGRVPKNSIYCNICGTKLEDASAEQAVMACANAEEAAEAAVEQEAPAEEAAATEAEVIAETVEEAIEEKDEPAVEEAAEDTVTVDDSSEDLFV